MNNAAQPAYPVEITHGETGEILGAQLSNNTGMALGLSKREYFAGLAMAAFLNAVTSVGGERFR